MSKAFRIRVDTEKNIAVITIDGRPSGSTLRETLESAIALPEFLPGTHRLWDLRQADLSDLTASSVTQLAKWSRQLPAEYSHVKVAFVVSRRLEFGLARMFEAYSHSDDRSVMAFYSTEEAERWLCASANSAGPITLT